MYCPQCGNKLPDGVSTCENCGWNEEIGTTASSNAKTASKTLPKKAIIAIIAVVIILAAAIGIYTFGSSSASVKKDDPSIKICGEWKSESAGFGVNTASDLQKYDRAIAIFNEDGTGTIDPTGDGTKLPWTWRYCTDETEKLDNGSLVYEVTFKGIENNPVYAIYEDEGFLMTLPKTSSSELTMYFVRCGTNEP